MTNWVQIVWHCIVELMPSLVAVAIYFVPGVLRQWKKFAYTPLYFSIYPLSRIKMDVVNKYIGSKYYYPPFLEDEDEAEKLRKKTVLRVALSFALDTVLIPVCVAFVFSLFLNKIQFIITLVLLLLIQTSRFLWSYFTLQKHMYGTVQFRRWVAFVYIIALFLIALAMVETWRWVISSLENGNYIQLFWNVADLLWGLFPTAMISTLLGAIITTALLDRKTRQGNTYGNQRPKSNQNVTTSRPFSKRTKRANKK